jgi:hypothetical protein
MAITHTRTIENLRVLNNGDDIVCQVEIRWVSSDDSNVERTTIDSTETYDLETEGVTPDSDGFVSFADLTEATVEGWVADQLAEEKTTERHTSWINSVLNPPAPRVVNKATPW